MLEREQRFGKRECLSKFLGKLESCEAERGVSEREVD